MANGRDATPFRFGCATDLPGSGFFGENCPTPIDKSAIETVSLVPFTATLNFLTPNDVTSTSNPPTSNVTDVIGASGRISNPGRSKAISINSGARLRGF